MVTTFDQQKTTIAELNELVDSLQVDLAQSCQQVHAVKTDQQELLGQQ